MTDFDGLADVVVLAVQNAMGPILQRLAVLEASLTRLPVTEAAVTDLRERLVVAETKVAVPHVPEINLDAALTPTVARLAALEANLARLPATEAAVTDLRDRIVMAETKAAIPAVQVAPDAGLTPLLERLASVETTLATIPATEQTLANVRDRVIACETKAASPVLPDPTVSDLRERVVAVEMHAADAAEALRARVTATETRLTTIDDVRDRLTSVETKADRPAPEPVLGDVRDRLVMLEIQTASATAATGELKARVSAVEQRVQDDGMTKTVAALSERVAVVEVRAQVPGPPGKDGKDGADGMGWDDLAVKHDGERTFTVQLIKGERVKEAGTFAVPVLIYRGIYTEGRTYEPGDTVTYGKSLWYCRKSTVLKPDGTTRDHLTGESKGAQGKDFWTLALKRAEDGRDGRDAPGALPVVSVGRVQ